MVNKKLKVLINFIKKPVILVGIGLLILEAKYIPFVYHNKNLFYVFIIVGIALSFIGFYLEYVESKKIVKKMN